MIAAPASCYYTGTRLTNWSARSSARVYTLIPTAMYWKRNKVKLEIALAKGKQAHDKRDSEKERDWQREKQRTLRHRNRDA
jgi:tmRNA-binding protein